MALQVFLLSALLLCGPPQEEKVDLGTLVPAVLDGWSIDGEDEYYDYDGIFTYMDGAGEVYRSYDYRSMFVRRYSAPGEEGITVEIYDMGNPADAYGIFSHGRQAEEPQFGGGSEFRSGYLIFWKDRYFVTVYTMQESDTSNRAVLDLAEKIDGTIPAGAGKPEIISLLPGDNLVPASVRFFHLYTGLNQFYFVADDNILNLGPETDAVLANYQKDDEFIYLVIIGYPGAGQAEAALKQFYDVYLPEGRSSGIAQLEDGLWTGIRHEGPYLVLVMDAGTSESAINMLNDVVAIIKGDK